MSFANQTLQADLTLWHAHPLYKEMFLFKKTNKLTTEIDNKNGAILTNRIGNN